MFGESLRSARERGDTRSIGHALEALGTLAVIRGEHARAVPLFQECIRYCLRVGNVEWLAYCLRGLAGVALAHHEPARAVRLLAVADGAWKSTGLSVWPLRRLFYAEIRERASARLGAAVFQQEWEAGLQCNLEDLVQELLGAAAADPQHSPSAVQPDVTPLNGPLLNREKVAFWRDRPRLDDARLGHFLCPKVAPLGILIRIQQTTVKR